MATALGTMITAAFNSNAAVPDQMNQHVHEVFSKELALQTLSPFAESASYSSKITLFSMQPNLGSLVRRKPNSLWRFRRTSCELELFASRHLFQY